MALTQAQSTLINNATPTYNWEEEAVASYEATGDDLMDELNDRFEQLFTDYTSSDDLGGLTVYFKGRKLVAFYDYEQFKGTVF
jgi:hypothetical protein